MLYGVLKMWVRMSSQGGDKGKVKNLQKKKFLQSNTIMADSYRLSAYKRRRYERKVISIAECISEMLNGLPMKPSKSPRVSPC